MIKFNQLRNAFMYAPGRRHAVARTLAVVVALALLAGYVAERQFAAPTYAGPITVTANMGQFSPNPVLVGAPATASLGAYYTPPSGVPEGQLSASYAWSIGAVQYKALQADTFGSPPANSYTDSISPQPQPSPQSGATLTFTPKIAGYWEASVRCKVNVTDTTTNQYWTNSSESGNAGPQDLTSATISLDAESILKDKPSDDTFKPLSGTPPNVYGGHMDSTSDKLRLTAKTSPTDANFPLTWKYTGPGGYASSGSGKLWELTVKPKYGLGNFKVSASNNSVISASQKIEIGIRTDDILVIAWINGAAVTLNAVGVRSGELYAFPPGGPSQMSMTQKGLAFTYLGFLLVYPSATFGVPGVISPRPLNYASRLYVLSWLFAYGGNPKPPSSFANESALKSYEGNPENFKLVNRFQLRFTVNARGWMVNQDELQRQSLIGTTDVKFIPGFQNVGVPGQAGPHNGFQSLGPTVAYHVSDGSPDQHAVDDFNVLMQPLKWNDIGSNIIFGPLPNTDYNVKNAGYPTYFIYDGLKLKKTVPQPASPAAHFNNYPYPPNTASAPWLYPGS